MAKRTHSKKLLVEGEDDKRVIPYLIEANGIRWGEKAHEAVVLIEAIGGYTQIVRPGLIQAELKSSGLRILGILLDADAHVENRWQSLRNRCRISFPDIPDQLPPEGLIVENEQGQRLGAWLLPDNRSHGMMETFLASLVPEHQTDLWTFCEESTMKARGLGATYIDAHIDKARLHSWLAWCDPPGQQLHDAIKQRIPTPQSPYAAGFVKWFRELYEL